MNPSLTLQFSHFGFCVRDLPRMARFYKEALRFTQTDAGDLGAVQLVFLSRDPNEHHQIVLATGRPAELAFNVINQISFRVPDLPMLRRFHDRLLEHGANDMHPVTHGNAISIYCRDPEGNRLELFVDTPWYCEQPLREPIDFAQTDAQILAQAEAIAKRLPRFMSRAAWQAEVARRMEETSVADAADAVFDVAIVGFGPTGATLANLLGSAGLSVLVIEKEAAVYPMPRAIHFDGEVMRIFQSIGLRDEVLAISRPGAQGMHFVNATGETMLIRGGTAALGPHGCANNYYFHQPELEVLLRDGASRFANVDVRLRHALVDIAQAGDTVRLSLRDLSSDEPRDVRARYVVGCDGARSTVRACMGSEMVDLGLRQPWLVFDVMLQREADLPDHTIQHCDPARPMTYCNVVGARRRWEIMVLPGDDPAALVAPDNLWRLVARWVTPADARLERAVIYTFHSVIAKGWRRGRLLLAGDACHQTPPFLGQGMCAGIRDVANLAWKLEAVLRSTANDELLDTYESERAPHVRSLIELAVRLGNIIQTTDPVLAAARDAKFEAGQPEIFELPAQMLGGGAFDTRPGSPAGRPFPQPRLSDGRLLDDVLGRRMAVIGRHGAIGGVSDATADRWRRSGAIVIDRPDARIAEWLDAHDADAVVLRPDRYIVGVARTAGDLERISKHLPAAP